MRIDTRPDGTQITIPEVGDLVRLTRDEAGPVPTAQAGEWGKIRSISDRGRLDIVLDGFSRPRDVALELPKWSNWRKGETSGYAARKDKI
jgi:hypothetical protein